MSILLFINAFCFMSATAILWFFGTIIVMVWSVVKNVFVLAIDLFTGQSIPVSEYGWVALVGFTEALTKYDDFFIIFWNFSRYDHPIFALIITLVIAGASSTRG